MPDDSFRDLTARVIEATRPYLERGLVALYAHGSHAGGEVDGWSDLDVCYIHHESEESLRAYREWMGEMHDRFEYVVDPVGAPLEQLGEGGHWSFAFLRDGLLRGATLLLGEDIRHLVSPPSEHLMRLSVLYTSLTWVRRLYEVPRWEPLPESLEGLTPQPLEAWEHGNAAWQAYMAVIQLLRAIVLLEMGVFCEGRREILNALQERGEEAAGLMEEALQVRAELPRFEEVERASPGVAKLLAAIPDLGERLFVDMARDGLADPTYEGPGGPYYAPDGSRRE